MSLNNAAAAANAINRRGSLVRRASIVQDLTTSSNFGDGGSSNPSNESLQRLASLSASSSSSSSSTGASLPTSSSLKLISSSSSSSSSKAGGSSSRPGLRPSNTRSTKGPPVRDSNARSTADLSSGPPHMVTMLGIMNTLKDCASCPILTHLLACVRVDPRTWKLLHRPSCDDGEVLKEIGKLKDFLFDLVKKLSRHSAIEKIDKLVGTGGLAEEAAFVRKALERAIVIQQLCYSKLTPLCERVQYALDRRGPVTQFTAKPFYRVLAPALRRFEASLATAERTARAQAQQESRRLRRQRSKENRLRKAQERLARLGPTSGANGVGVGVGVGGTGSERTLGQKGRAAVSGVHDDDIDDDDDDDDTDGHGDDESGNGEGSNDEDDINAHHLDDDEDDATFAQRIQEYVPVGVAATRSAPRAGGGGGGIALGTVNENSSRLPGSGGSASGGGGGGMGPGYDDDTWGDQAQVPETPITFPAPGAVGGRGRAFFFPNASTAGSMSGSASTSTSSSGYRGGGGGGKGFSHPTSDENESEEETEDEWRVFDGPVAAQSHILEQFARFKELTLEPSYRFKPGGSAKVRHLQAERERRGGHIQLNLLPTTKDGSTNDAKRGGSNTGKSRSKAANGGDGDAADEDEDGELGGLEKVEWSAFGSRKWACGDLTDGHNWVPDFLLPNSVPNVYNRDRRLGLGSGLFPFTDVPPLPPLLIFAKASAAALASSSSTSSSSAALTGVSSNGPAKGGSSSTSALSTSSALSATGSSSSSMDVNLVVGFNAIQALFQPITSNTDMSSYPSTKVSAPPKPSSSTVSTSSSASTSSTTASPITLQLNSTSIAGPNVGSIGTNQATASSSSTSSASPSASGSTAAPTSSTTAPTGTTAAVSDAGPVPPVRRFQLSSARFSWAEPPADRLLWIHSHFQVLAAAVDAARKLWSLYSHTVIAQLTCVALASLLEEKERYVSALRSLERTGAHAVRYGVPLTVALLEIDPTIMGQNILPLSFAGIEKGPHYRKLRQLIREMRLMHDCFAAADIHLFPSAFQAHKGAIKAMAVSSLSPHYVLTGGADGVLRIWDTLKQQCLAQYVGHTSIISWCSFLSLDTLLVSASFDGTIKVWESKTANCQTTLTGHKDSILACDLLKNQYLVTGSMDCTLRLWTLPGGQCLREYRGHRHWVTSVKFSSSGSVIASCGMDRQILVWSFKGTVLDKDVQASAAVPLHVTQLHTDFVVDLVPMPSLKFVTASRDKTIRMWNQTNGAPDANLSNPNSSTATSLAVSPNGKLLAAAMLDYTVLIYDTSTGMMLRSLKVHCAGISKLVFATNRTILLATTDGQVMIVSL